MGQINKYLSSEFYVFVYRMHISRFGCGSCKWWAHGETFTSDLVYNNLVDIDNACKLLITRPDC